jgi:transcriptional regulator with XRE-family HTH domain
MRPANPGGGPWAIDRLIGGRLRYRRILLGLSQDELGALVGVALQQIQRHELGAERVRPEMLLLLSRMLGVSLSYFFAEESYGAEFGATACGADEEARTCRDAAASAEVLELLRAFADIEDEFLRRRVLSLVRSIAERERLGRN